MCCCSYTLPRAVAIHASFSSLLAIEWTSAVLTVTLGSPYIVPDTGRRSVQFVTEFHFSGLRTGACLKLSPVLHCSVLFFSRCWSKGWPHHGRTFSIYPCPLSFWLTLPGEVLSMSWCCPSRPCVVFLACMHLALFLALSLSPGNSLVSSWYDHSRFCDL